MAIPSSLLRDRVVVITGASQGIGRGIALGCAQAGARVVVHHLGTEAALQDARSLLQEIEQIASTRQGGEDDAGTAAAAAAAIEVGGDIADPATADRIVAAALAAYGRIDGLVSNAGICPFYSFLDIPHAAWEKTRSVNLDGAFYVVQAVARQMSQQQEPKGGSIVAVSSISALVGGGQQAHYTPTKAGVKSLMESCAISLSPYGIRCNSVLPGTIETPINEQDLAADSDKRAYMEKRIPLGRLGKPENLAGPTVFLLSDMAQYVTGASLLVDGGAFVNLQ